MTVLRRVAACSLALCAVTALASCSDSESASAPTSTSTAEPQEYDLARLSELERDMPPGFIASDAEVKKLHHAYVASVGTVVSGSKPFTVDPPQCKVLLKPVDGVRGSDSIGFRADSAEKRSIGVGADVPVDVPAEIPATGCDRMTFAVPDDNHPTAGTVERIAAPTIDGATTLGLKIAVDGFPDPEYFYGAIVDNRLFVNVNARLAPDFQAQPLLPDLLVKAVAAVRGQ